LDNYKAEKTNKSLIQDREINSEDINEKKNVEKKKGEVQRVLISP